VTSFRPIIEEISIRGKKIREAVTGSIKKTIPTTAVPKAPIQVHTAKLITRRMV
jgi:hypothetical protein